jgi:hypothetical protein
MFELSNLAFLFLFWHFLATVWATFAKNWGILLQISCHAEIQLVKNPIIFIVFCPNSLEARRQSLLKVI